jgi:hypothetical protein
MVAKMDTYSAIENTNELKVESNAYAIGNFRSVFFK